MSDLLRAAEVLARTRYGSGFDDADDRDSLVHECLPMATALAQAGLLRDRTQEVLDRADAYVQHATATLKRSHRLDHQLLIRE